MSDEGVAVVDDLEAHDDDDDGSPVVLVTLGDDPSAEWVEYLTDWLSDVVGEEASVVVEKGQVEPWLVDASTTGLQLRTVRAVSDIWDEYQVSDVYRAFN